MNSVQPILTPGGNQNNEMLKNELYNLVATGQSLLFVGAGCSAIIGYDTWPSLLLKLEKLACDCGVGFIINGDKREKFPLYYADDIKLHIIKTTGDLSRYYALIDDLFSVKDLQVNDFHNKLVGLPFSGFVTTNYDKVIDNALAQNQQNPVLGTDNSIVVKKAPGGSGGRVRDFLLSLTDTEKYLKRILHLHGRYDEPDSIILSRKDYESAYGFKIIESKSVLEVPEHKWRLHRKLLWAILATRRVVFVGFSMDDPYFNTMLGDLSSDLWNWDKSIHFAVMGISPSDADKSNTEAKFLKSQYGIDVVFYERTDTEEPHHGLVNLVNEMVARYTVSTTQTISGEEEKHGEVKVEHVSKRGRKKRDNASFPSWMREINKRMEARMNSHED